VVQSEAGLSDPTMLPGHRHSAIPPTSFLGNLRSAVRGRRLGLPGCP
jgi:hypothetical protein